MANMGYCRFRNTLLDLSDCYDHLDEKPEEEEKKAKERLIKMCVTIACEYGEQVGVPCEKVSKYED